VNLVVDLGSNQGLWAVQTCANLKSGKFPALITVEPDPLCSALIMINLLALKPRQHLIHHHYIVALVKKLKQQIERSSKYFKINFYSDRRSTGHQTLEAALVPKQYRMKKEVTAVHAEDFFQI
jgi:hypothetical protein